MRNIGLGRSGRAALLLSLATLLTGCAVDPARQELEAARQALAVRNYDEAQRRVDAYLQADPDGPGAAEALYLRGRAILDRPATDARQAQQNLQAARVAFVNALNQDPPEALDANIRSDLANVAFFQDDYATAAEQWRLAYRALQQPAVRALALYRVGVSQQRLGHFEQADKTFSDVRRLHPNTEAARLAAEKQGKRQFYVRAGVYTTEAGANAAISSLRALGLTPARTTDEQGRTVILAGPTRTYAEARVLRDRAYASFPDALIIP